MTDTTDIAALPKMTLDELLIRCTDYDDGSLSMDAGELKMLNQHISLLESARQRAEALQGQLDYRNEVLTRAIRQREAAETGLSAMEGVALALRDEVRELKGDQVPVALVDERQGSGGFCLTQYGRRLNLQHGTELFTVPQKPVVCFGDIAIHENLPIVGALVSYKDVVELIEAAGGIVKDGQ